MWAQPRHRHTFHTGVKGSNSRSSLWFHKTRQGTTTSVTRAWGKQLRRQGGVKGGQSWTLDKSAGVIWVPAMWQEEGSSASALHLTPAGDRFPGAVRVLCMDQLALRSKSTYETRERGHNKIARLLDLAVIHTLNCCAHELFTGWLKASRKLQLSHVYL